MNFFSYLGFEPLQFLPKYPTNQRNVGTGTYLGFLKLIFIIFFIFYQKGLLVRYDNVQVHQSPFRINRPIF